MNSTFLLLALAGGRLGPNTLGALAKMRAVVVLPVPRPPQKRNA